MKAERETLHATHAQDPVHPPVHESEERPWEEPINLRAPEARPGMVQRWVRTAIRDEEDVRNVSKARQEGWEPRRADTVPKGFSVPTISHGEYAGVVGVHGLILCEMSENRVAKRREYFENKTKRQTQAVARDLANVSNPRMPLIQERESEVIKGRQRRPVVAEDSDA